VAFVPCSHSLHVKSEVLGDTGLLIVSLTVSMYLEMLKSDLG